MKKYEPDYVCTLSNDEALIIEYMSKKLVSYKRIHELALLKHLIIQQERVSVYYKELMKANYGLDVSTETENSVYRNLVNEFPKEEERKYYPCVFVKQAGDGGYRLDPDFQRLLTNPEFRSMVMELIDFGEEDIRKTTVRHIKIRVFSFIRNIHMKMSAVCSAGRKI